MAFQTSCSHGLEALAIELGRGWEKAHAFDCEAIDASRPREVRDRASAAYDREIRRVRELEKAAGDMPITNDREAFIAAALLVEHLQAVSPFVSELEPVSKALIERACTFAEKLAAHLERSGGHDARSLGLSAYADRAW